MESSTTGIFSTYFVVHVKDNDTVVQVNCSITSHCYIANVSKLVIPNYNNKGIDIVLFCPGYRNYILDEKVDGMYGIYPRMLVMQSSKESTIDSSRNSHGDLHFNRNHLIKLALAVNYVKLIIILALFLLITIVIIIIFKCV